jgi:hypothetical protein
MKGKTLHELALEHPNKTYTELSALQKRVNELDNSLSIALDINDRYQRENVVLKKRAQEVEGENTIIKGIGNTSPEMKALQVRVKEAGEINKLHQELNGKLQTRLTEVEEDNKRLTKQISDHIKNKEDIIRKAGL